MDLGPPVLPDHWNASPNENSPDLEKQYHSGSVQNKETLWGRIWILLTLLSKTGTSAILSRASRNVPSKQNTRVSLDGPELDPLDDSTELTQAQPDSASMPSVDNGIRVHSSPSLPTRNSSTLAANDACSSCSISSSREGEEIVSSDLDDIISLIERAGCNPSLAPTSTQSARDSDVSEAMQRPRPSQRESTIIPPFLYPLRS